MKKIFVLFFPFYFFVNLFSQEQVSEITISDSQILNLDILIEEALQKNSELKAKDFEIKMSEKKVEQEKIFFPSPEIQFMQEQIPGFNISDGIIKIELMQMFHLPKKIETMTQLQKYNLEHSGHYYFEKVNEIIYKVKTAYFELWFVQQNIFLNRETKTVLEKILSSEKEKLSSSQSSLQNVLNTEIEIAKLDNKLLALREQEISMKSMLSSLLNRNEKDTLGFATISEEISFDMGLEEIFEITKSNSFMLKHDSVNIEIGKTMIEMAQNELYPDFKIGLGYNRIPMDNFSGWQFSVGISLPFVPWTIEKKYAKIEEEKFSLKMSEKMQQNDLIMTREKIRSLYFKMLSYKSQFENFQENILPKYRQLIDIQLIAYQNSKLDFMKLLDSHKMYLEHTMDYFMIRMNFEQSVAELELECCLVNFKTLKK